MVRIVDGWAVLVCAGLLAACAQSEGGTTSSDRERNSVEAGEAESSAADGQDSSAGSSDARDEGADSATESSSADSSESDSSEGTSRSDDDDVQDGASDSGPSADDAGEMEHDPLQGSDDSLSCPDAIDVAGGCWFDSDCGAARCVPIDAVEPCIGVAPEPEPGCWEPGGRACLDRFECVAGQGCAPLACEDNAHCQPGYVCDPGAEGTLADGCRRGDCRAAEIVCEESGERCNQDTGSCEHHPCDDASAPACPDGESCSDQTGYCAPPGYVCTWVGCRPLHCSEEGAFACPEGSMCDANSNTETGCRSIPCDQLGGPECADGSVCDPGAAPSGGNGCRWAHCTEQGAPPCPDDSICVPTAALDGCVECVTDGDCGCGVCRDNTCRTGPPPGVCQVGCP